MADWSFDLDPTPILRGPIGDLLARPWLDKVSLSSIGRYLIPTSRLWAAAELAGTDIDRFLAEAGLVEPSPAKLALLPQALALTARMGRRYRKAEAAWRAAFFPADGAEPADAARLKAIQARRGRTARDWMACRGLFLPFLPGGVRGVHFAIPAPQEMADRYGARMAGPGGLYALPVPLPGVTESLGYDAGGRRWSWIRLDHDDGSHGWARVGTPLGVENPVTVISLHGLAMELEMWNSRLGQAEDMLDPSIRVIQPEAPFHSRNRMAGRWGGEEFIATLPAGAVALFQKAFPEVAALTAWSRETSAAPVGLAGVSMGALTAQRLAVEAKAWPENLRPDALFLASTSEDLLEVATEGALGRLFGIHAAAEQAGWTVESLARWSPFLDPVGPSCLPPDRIVLALGTVDDVTPFDGGRQLAERWQVPDDNVFVRQVGHFSAPVSLYRDPAPVERFAMLLQQA